jgi:hypothetical protein
MGLYRLLGSAVGISTGADTILVQTDFIEWHPCTIFGVKTAEVN